MENNNLEQIKNKIRNMPMDEFVSHVNQLACATRYCPENSKVCELLEVRNSTIKVVKIDPEYFGIYSNKMRIDHLKNVYLRNIENAWATMEKEDQELIFSAFC